VSPIHRETSAPLPEIVRLGETLAPGAEIGRRRTSSAPSQKSRPQFGEKHDRWDPKGGFSATCERGGLDLGNLGGLYSVLTPHTHAFPHPPRPRRCRLRQR
jgi:hypothetical protein